VSLFDRGPVRDLLQLQSFPQLGPLRDEANGLAVVGMKELTQRQQREELGLGEVLSASHAGVRGQALSADTQGHLGEIDGRFGHGPHGIPPLALHGSLSTVS